MSRTLSIILGFGLLMLWAVGLSMQDATDWLMWIDGIVGVCAAIMGLAMSRDSSKSLLVGGPVIVSLGLFALWIVGLLLDATSWLSWWTFGFACAFLLTGFASTSSPMTPHRHATT